MSWMMAIFEVRSGQNYHSASQKIADMEGSGANQMQRVKMKGKLHAPILYPH
jgi:hypothetical protein